jgi:1-acyl-sn-glycerol-3-phosphate acyltransferase
MPAIELELQSAPEEQNRPEGPAGPRLNPFLYGWRVFSKWSFFALFGFGTLNLVVFFFPLMRLFLHPRRRFQKHARFLICLIFRVFVWLMRLSGTVRLETDDRQLYKQLAGKIVAANHPSLLDVVMLISLVPNADCIVRSGLSKTIVSGVIRQLYIPNELSFDKLLEGCRNSLMQGNCIIIFPEGTRTPRQGKAVYKKGAARIALDSGCPVVPVQIGGNDKYGLGKRDPWTSFAPDGKYIYKIRMGKELLPQNYNNEPSGIRRLAADIRESLLHPPV